MEAVHQIEPPRQRRIEHLDRDPPSQTSVLCLIDRASAAAADQRQNVVLPSA
jgi:hypothetical protein